MPFTHECRIGQARLLKIRAVLPSAKELKAIHLVNEWMNENARILSAFENRLRAVERSKAGNGQIVRGVLSLRRLWMNYKCVGPPYCRAEVYPGRVAYCPLVSHEGTYGRTPDLTLSLNGTSPFPCGRILFLPYRCIVHLGQAVCIPLNVLHWRIRSSLANCSFCWGPLFCHTLYIYIYLAEAAAASA